MSNEGWHAPGIGEVHNQDHSRMIYCFKIAIQDGEEIEVVDDELARIVCAALPRSPGAEMNDQPKRISQTLNSC